MRPSPTLCARIRFTTKEVGRGFYRGNRTGSMGAHTEYGGYVLDWRKVRHYNVPELAGFTLTPFVTKELPPTPRWQERDGVRYEEPKYVDAVEYLRQWKEENPMEYRDFREQQDEARKEALQQAHQEHQAEHEEPNAEIRGSSQGEMKQDDGRSPSQRIP